MKAWALLFWLLGGLALGQDVPAQLSGRMDSSWNWVEAGVPGGGNTLGLVGGRASLVAGTTAVKSELRVDVSSYPALTASMNRAWLKFRFPGMRFTTGWGRVAWGPGFVLVPGDLLFDSTSSPVNFQADELRSAGTWVADGWFSLGEEAFVETAALKDAAALRVSMVVSGITVEAAGAWNQTRQKAAGALSTQFHLGVDWYATVRETGACSLGAFALWDLGEGWTLSSRHEALVPESSPWDNLRSYHDATVAGGEGWSLGARGMYARADAQPWTVLGEVRWTPLQNLSLWAGPGWHETWSARVGATAKW